MDNDELKTKTSVNKRLVEINDRSNTIHSMYRCVLESVMNMYTDDRDNQFIWQNFRRSADKLAEMYKYIKVTILKAHELAIVEGASSFSSEFIGKIRDFQRQTSDQDIPFAYLSQYLCRPEDEPPKCLRRIRRSALRRTRRKSSANAFIKKMVFINPLQSNEVNFPRNSAELWHLNPEHSKWNSIQPNRTNLGCEMDCGSDDSGTSPSSCTCDTDSISSNDDTDDSSGHSPETKITT